LTATTKIYDALRSSSLKNVLVSPEPRDDKVVPPASLLMGQAKVVE